MMEGQDRLCVLSAGACTSVGLTAAASAAAVRAGIARFAEHPSITDRISQAAIVARPPAEPPEAAAEERLARLALDALSDALGAIPNPRDFGPLPIIVALPEPRPGVDARLADAVAAHIAGRVGSNGTVSAVPQGHAAGGVALQQAARRLGAAGWAAIVGVDSYISAETIAWLDGNRQLHATYNAWGFIPGEAAGACVISTLASARARGSRPLALIEGIGIEQEDVPIKTDGVCLGWGLTRAARSALAGLAPEEAVDRIYCDQNGETYRADELGFMLARLAGRFRDPAGFVAPADCWGDVGAATVPLLVALAAAAAERGYAAGPVSLVLAGSESGRRTSVLLRTPVRSA
jgi:3-oxoacyl-[acyl-carrier-protein] synthase-1